MTNERLWLLLLPTGLIVGFVVLMILIGRGDL